MLDDPVTAQYTHTLTVTGRLGGQYQCAVSNNKPSVDSTHQNIKGMTKHHFVIDTTLLVHALSVASAPSNLQVVQKNSLDLRLSWTPPTPLGDTTGYRIYYSGGSSGSVDVSGGSTNSHLPSGLQSQTNYSISIVGTSDHLPSARVDIEYGECSLSVHAIPVVLV